VFTGLIADVGSVTELSRDSAGARLRISTPLAAQLQDGDSIAVSGVCLTACELEGATFAAEMMTETLRRSALGELQVGSLVNLELALRAADRLGGHVVQGHVDATATVARISDDGIARSLEIEVDPRLERYLVEKGSVAIDGVSLTVGALHDRGFAVSLIPETRRRTTLGALVAGSRVNVEVDVLAKHVERLMTARAEGAVAEQPA
jgi:riboflavin synthase